MTKIYDFEQFAQTLGKSKQWIYTLRKNGVLEPPVYVCGKRKFWSQDQVDNFVKQYGYLVRPRKVKGEN